MHPCGSHAVIGKKGGGKSHLATKLGLKIVAETPRVLVTNLPLHLAQCRQYLKDNYPAWSEDIHERVTIIPDAKTLKRFWLTRGNDWWIRDVPPDEFKLGRRLDFREAYRWLPTTADVKHRKLIPDLTEAEIQAYLGEGPMAHDPPEMEAKLVPDLPPVQFIIDELQNIFPARGFMQTSQGCLFWLSQQRHLGDDLIWISQNADLVDKEFRDLTDDWLYITNWGRKRKSIFRLPKVMTWAKYDQRPGPGVSPMVQGTFRLDIEGIGQCYDTSAGVGIEGGLKADTKESVGGIHWAWFLVAIAVGLYLLFQTPKALTHFFVGLFTKPAAAQSALPSPAPQPPNRQASPVQNSPPPSIPGQAPNARLKPNGNVKEPPPMHVTGIVAWNGITTAYLSDGSSVSSVDPRWGGKTLDANGRINGCLIDGRRLTVGAPRGLEGGALERPDGRWLSSGDRR